MFHCYVRSREGRERERESKSSGQAILPCLNTPSRTISLFRWRCSIYSSLNWWFKKKGGIYHLPYLPTFPKLPWLIINFHHQLRKTVAYFLRVKKTRSGTHVSFSNAQSTWRWIWIGSSSGHLIWVPEPSAHMY